MKRMFFAVAILLSLGIKSVLVAGDNEFFDAEPCALIASPAHESLAVLQELADSKLASSKKQRPASCILFSSYKPFCRRRSLESLKKDASEY
jgi:hypothetical protein